MNHLFVPYELAVKLKEKGFDEYCFAHYEVNNNVIIKRAILKSSAQIYYNQNNINPNNQYGDRFCTAPLYQQAVDWLREKHNIHIEIVTGGHPKKYYVFVPKMVGGWIYDGNNQKEFDYYDGLVAGINEALKLI